VKKMPIPIARVAGESTRIGRLTIRPAGNPATSPSPISIATTSSLRAVITSPAANAIRLATRTSTCRPVRSPISPPSGTESAISHSTMLVDEAAAVSDQPRSVSISVPNPKTTPRPAL
jgi:hypothetical protein